MLPAPLDGGNSRVRIGRAAGGRSGVFGRIRRPARVPPRDHGDRSAADADDRPEDAPACSDDRSPVSHADHGSPGRNRAVTRRPRRAARASPHDVLYRYLGSALDTHDLIDGDCVDEGQGHVKAGPTPRLRGKQPDGYRHHVTTEPSTERSRWTIHGERLIDDSPHVRISTASVELPNGVTFEQYVFRMRRCVMAVVLDHTAENILLIWRHRFIVDQWDWEVPGGYADPGENGAVTAAREAEEETGWRPTTPKFLLSYQPMVGSADAPQDIYVSYGAELVGEPEIDEAELVRWVPIAEAQDLIARGEILGAATVIGVMHAAAVQAAGLRRTP